MIFNIKHVANWKFIRENKQKLIDKNNKAETSKQAEHTYKLGDLVLLRRGTENKYETSYQGPFPILKVNNNGTVCFKVQAVEDTYNIRSILPYFSADDSNHGGECSMPTFNTRRSARLAEPTKDN